MPDAESWQRLALVNPKALDDQVEAIGLVARELGPGVPVIQTVFSPLTVAGYLVGRSKSRVMRDLRKNVEVVGPALERIAFIRRAQRLGFSLAEVESLLRYLDGRSWRETRQIAEKKYAGLSLYVSQLNKMRRSLKKLPS